MGLEPLPRYINGGCNLNNMMRIWYCDDSQNKLQVLRDNVVEERLKNELNINEKKTENKVISKE